MSSFAENGPQEEAVRKIIRRAEVSRITRVLRSRLSLAKYKTSHGLQNLATDQIDPELLEEWKKENFKDSSQNESEQALLGKLMLPFSETQDGEQDQNQQEQQQQQSSPRNLFQIDHHELELKRRGGQYPSKRPRTYTDSRVMQKTPDEIVTVTQTFSSPMQPSRNDASETKRGNAAATLPSTPKSLTRNRPAGLKLQEEVADVLLYLATSPSPATTEKRTDRNIHSLSLDDWKSGPDNLGFSPNTPSQKFDLSDFVNISPSPARINFRHMANTPNLFAPKSSSIDSSTFKESSDRLQASLQEKN